MSVDERLATAVRLLDHEILKERPARLRAPRSGLKRA
jgi:hypothetical protein